MSEAVLRSLLGLELALIRHRREVRRRLGVSEDELAVLLCLTYEGATAQARLMSVTTLSRSGMGALVQRLEHAGLIERRAVSGDRRVRLVRLTANGRERLAAASRERDEALTRLDVPAGLLDDLARAAGAPAAEPEEPALSAATGDPIWRRWG